MNNTLVFKIICHYLLSKLETKKQEYNSILDKTNDAIYYLNKNSSLPCLYCNNIIVYDDYYLLCKACGIKNSEYKDKYILYILPIAYNPHFSVKFKNIKYRSLVYALININKQVNDLDTLIAKFNIYINYVYNEENGLCLDNEDEYYSDDYF